MEQTHRGNGDGRHVVEPGPEQVFDNLAESGAGQANGFHHLGQLAFHKGDAEFAVERDGQTFYLANAKAKKMFDKAPAKYDVAYHGWCAAGMAKGMQVESDPTEFVVLDGRTYLFSNAEAKAMFEKSAGDMVMMADKNWSKESGHAHGH